MKKRKPLRERLIVQRKGKKDQTLKGQVKSANFASDF